MDPVFFLSIIFAFNAYTQTVDTSKIRPAYVEGTNLIVTKKDGTKVSGKGLIGAVIIGKNEEGKDTAFKIENIEKDSNDKDGDVLLYTLSVKDPQTSQWVSYCNPDKDGVKAGFPLKGSWNSNGVHQNDDLFIITCTSGVIGKCVRFGYKPWKKGPNGESLWDYHQACTRLVRADYCGNGIGHTKEGTQIDIIDRIFYKLDDNKTLAFEAGWGTDGAICLAKTRLIPSPWSIDDIVKECPEKLKGHTNSKSCTFEGQKKNSKALLFNKS